MMADTLLFRRQSPPPPPWDWLVVSFDRGNKLKVVGFPPPELAAALVECFGIRVRRHEITASRLKIKFRGYPWEPHGTNTVDTRVIVLKLLETLEAFGFTLYGSVRITDSGGNYNIDTEADVLVVHRCRDGTSGASNGQT